jgi:hypothetical protein
LTIISRAQNYEAQQTDEPVDADFRDKLGSLVPGDHGAHGSFDKRARNYSAQSRLNTHRGWLLLARVTVTACGTLLWRKAR